MATLFSYLRLILFLGGVLVGIQAPVFVDHYGNRLEAHFLESEAGLREFRVDAQTHFGGDMKALIDHYKHDGDPVFQEGGKSIQRMHARFVELKEALFDFRQNAWKAYWQAIFAPVSDIQKEVVKNYSYAIKLDFGAILFGLVSGLILTVLGELALRALLFALALLNKRLQPTFNRV